MPITSYSLLFEDVRLWNALRTVENGVYVDIGAALPKHESVTQLFYERGWSGINVEPTDSRYPLLARERPRDTNLKCLVGERAGSLPFFSVRGGNGLSTTVAEYAKGYAAQGMDVAESRIACLTLAEIWARYVHGPVHFLKIDVEGGEEQVLRGADFLVHRPWVVVIEATLPRSQIAVHDRWEYLITDCGYLFAHSDGYNRFYVATEHAALAAALERPLVEGVDVVKWVG